MNEEVKIIEVKPLHADLMALITRLDDEMLEKYPQDGIFGVDFSDPKVSRMLFVVAYLGDAPVGCGGIRPLDDETVELKRFFVDKTFRNKGIASKVLTYLETKAREKGCTVIKLETGPEQPEAIGLYKKFGYIEIPAYGEYVGCEYSVCFEKKL